MASETVILRIPRHRRPNPREVEGCVVLTRAVSAGCSFIDRASCSGCCCRLSTTSFHNSRSCFTLSSCDSICCWEIEVTLGHCGQPSSPPPC